MARPQKAKLDYFPLDCGFFNNPKIKPLRRAHGTIGIMTYLNLLCKVYANGYYLKYESLTQLSYDIAEEIVNDRIGKVASSVTECVHYLADKGLIDKDCLDKGVITSRAIQEQYITSMEKCKRKGKIMEFRLIDSNFTVPKIEVSSEETEVITEETPENMELMQQSKSNQTKQNQTKYIDSQTAEADENEIEFYLDNINYRISELNEDYGEYKQRVQDIINQAVKLGRLQINKVDVQLTEFLKAIISLFANPIQIMDVFDTVDSNPGVKNKFSYTVAALYNTAMKF